MRIAAERLFDGYSWHDDRVVTLDGSRIAAIELDDHAQSVDHRVGVAVPGLVDCGALATGYSERPSADPFAPERAFAALSLRYGVTTIIDMGSALQSVTATDAFDSGRRPNYAFCGGRLTDRPSLRTDLLVTEDTAARIVAGLRLAGATFLALGHFDRDTVADHVREAAAACELPVAWSARSGELDTPGWIWSPHAPSQLAKAFGAEVEAHWVTPALHHASHWTIDGLLDATEAHLATPVLPYARNFRRSSGRIGRRIGRDILTSLYGERDERDLGANRTRVARRALRDGTCLAGSGAGSAGMVPGLSLWRELASLAALSDPTTALHAATGAPATAGLTTAGVIRPGAQADMVLLDSYDVVDQVPDPTLIQHLVLRGDVTSVDQLTHDVQEITTQAMQEAPA